MGQPAPAAPVDVATPLSGHLQQVEPGLTPARRGRGLGGLHSPVTKLPVAELLQKPLSWAFEGEIAHPGG